MTGFVQHSTTAPTPFHQTTRVLSSTVEEKYSDTQPFLNPPPMSHARNLHLNNRLWPCNQARRNVGPRQRSVSERSLGVWVQYKYIVRVSIESIVGVHPIYQQWFWSVVPPGPALIGSASHESGIREIHVIYTVRIVYLCIKYFHPEWIANQYIIVPCALPYLYIKMQRFWFFSHLRYNNSSMTP